MSKATHTQSDVRFETTAAWAEAETSNPKLAQEVEGNAEQLHNAAEEAATKAQYKSPAVAVDRLEQGLSEKTDQATTQGAVDVQSYAQQAKNLASSAVNTAQSYIPSSSTPTTTGNQSGGVLNTLTSTAGAAASTTKEYLVAAQNAAAPVAANALGAGLAAVESAKTTATPYVQTTTATVSKTLGGSGTASTHTEAQSAPASGLPSKTAPLESGPHVIGTPYPQSATGSQSKAGEV